jgi:hypothetical protein
LFVRRSRNPDETEVARMRTLKSILTWVKSTAARERPGD